MVDSLFENKPGGPKAGESYTAQDIQVLEGLEPVRHRPGMYIGGTDEKALHHLAAEIIDNAMDEVLAGFAKLIRVHLNANLELTVEDNGRGIPIDPHPKYPGKSALEVILTTLHSGGKFTDKVYSTSGGLHGVGISVVNALSDSLSVFVGRSKKVWRQDFCRGLAVSKLREEPIQSFQGSRITFHPDPEIFGTLHFKPAVLFKMLQEKAYLHKGVKILWSCASELVEGTPLPPEATFFYANGLDDYLNEKVGITQTDADAYPRFSGNATFPDSQGKVEWAVIWPLDAPETLDDKNITSFCNAIPTPLGGTHEAGFKQALTKSLKEYAERLNVKQAGQITPEDIESSCFSVLSAFVKQPQFQGQTKEKLVSAAVTRYVESAIKDHFDHWFAEHPPQALSIINFVAEFAERRLKRKQSKEISRASATKKLRLPGKLADCTSPIAEESEIFLVEGDSAGGSAKQARDRTTQAVLPLKGKILNVATASWDKLKQNQEINDLITALGCGIGKQFDAKKLRYHKIIIMTDADVDGAHIASLLLTFFYQEMPAAIEEGYVYLAQPPLYRLSHNGKTAYAKDDAEKDKLLKTMFGKATKVDISRFKGLGEMPVNQLKATTMSPENRTLLRVVIDQGNINTDGEDFVLSLMGKNAEVRFKFIQEHAAFAKDVDV
jgi:topoisomerase-4 subunit B